VRVDEDLLEGVLAMEDGARAHFTARKPPLQDAGTEE